MSRAVGAAAAGPEADNRGGAGWDATVPSGRAAEPSSRSRRLAKFRRKRSAISRIGSCSRLATMSSIERPCLIAIVIMSKKRNRSAAERNLAQFGQVRRLQEGFYNDSRLFSRRGSARNGRGGELSRSRGSCALLETRLSAPSPRSVRALVPLRSDTRRSAVHAQGQTVRAFKFPFESTPGNVAFQSTDTGESNLSRILQTGFALY
ncbi:hypothetical protein SAMN03080610_02294 [Afifella marina DSM 2698]|uniref:Uncharacterized protein n=1 Tax=Afifella marina DSM 2698 TaxID=1120955 RepID=A0A1G5NMB3_AFIMA|nr:hypothetical protein SAMN03080610_02294 [Afifella marina DSM 2698]